MASHPIYRFYAELLDYEPKMWRRFELMGNATAARLGYVVMTLFEMEASHLFAIEIPFGEQFEKRLHRRWPEKAGSMSASDYLTQKEMIHRYEVIYDDLDWADDSPHYEQIDATSTFSSIKHIFPEPGDTAIMEYDFGDGWQVKLVLEEIYEDRDLPANQLPRVLDGGGFGIIEDCGGPGGLMVAASLMDGRKPDGFGSDYLEGFEEWLEWRGFMDADLDAFDIEDMNFRLKRIPRIYMQAYEKGLAPTQQSLDLIQRKYRSTPQ